jgi:hypothetical protein
MGVGKGGHVALKSTSPQVYFCYAVIPKTECKSRTGFLTKTIQSYSPIIEFAFLC